MHMSIIRKIHNTLYIILTFLPLTASAQSLGTLNNIALYIRDIVYILLPIAFILILFFFFWGLAMYVRSAGDEDSKDRGRRLMVGGVLALFVAATIWGLVAFIGRIFNIDRSDNAEVRVPGVNSNYVSPGSNNSAVGACSAACKADGYATYRYSGGTCTCLRLR